MSELHWGKVSSDCQVQICICKPEPDHRNYGEDTIDELLAEDNYDAETDAGHEQQQAEQQQDNVNQQPADHGTVATTQTQDTKEVSYKSLSMHNSNILPNSYPM